MYQVKVNDKYSFAIQTDKNQIIVDDVVIELDRIILNGNTAHVLYQNKSYLIENVDSNKEDKSAIIKINGNIYTLNLEDQYDQLLKQLGMDSLAVSKILQIKAPMPGLVLSVLVSDGDEVKKGDNLLVLEAMKMENMIKSPTDGIVKNIAIIKGEKVEKNQLLISFS